MNPSKDGRSITAAHRYFECAVLINAAKMSLEEAEQALLDELDLKAAGKLKLATQALTEALVCLHQVEHRRNH